MPGTCRSCGRRSDDQDICDRCIAKADADEERADRYGLDFECHVPRDPYASIRETYDGQG
jgi:hypothetical protein